MGKASRDKGKRGELLARDLLRRVWPGAYRTGDQRRSTDEPGPPDVEGTPYWVEVKFQQRINIWEALKQAQRDRAAAHAEHRPVLLYLRRNNTPPIVVHIANEWIEREAGSAFMGALLKGTS